MDERIAKNVECLKLLEVKEKGIKQKERLIIDVKKNCNLSDYMIYDNSYKNDGTLSNKHRHIYRFPNQNVTNKDLVVLYTDEGKDHSRENENGGYNYYYFMNLEKETIWNKGNDVVHLVYLGAEQDLKV